MSNFQDRIKICRQNAFKIFEHNPKKFSIGWFYGFFIITIILLNTVSIIFWTVDGVKELYFRWYVFLWYITAFTFTVDYLLRFWCCIEKEKYSHPIIGRIKHFFSIYSIIDLLVLFSLSLEIFQGKYSSLIKLLVLFMFFKFFRFSVGFRGIISVIRNKTRELLISFTFIIFLFVIFSILMYYLEYKAQPQVFADIPHAMWWCIITLTSVGYGDIVPVTTWGKIIGGLVAVLGVLSFVLPTGILASGFTQYFTAKEISEQKKNCKNCGHPIDE